ncbi:MAG: YceI family protein [Bacteroidales bacterium]
MTKFILPLCLMLFSILSFCQEAKRTIFKADKGLVSFTSDAPLEIIRAESEELKGIVDPVKNSFAFQLNTTTLTGFNSPLQQEHFYENYIETEKYPTASFSGKIIEQINFDKPGKQTIRAKGILEIHGVKNERIIKVDIETGNQVIIAKSTFFVNLDDHNISIPKLVYQKIAEEIMVDIDVVLQLTSITKE